jgi:hypothetical protein
MREEKEKIMAIMMKIDAGLPFFSFPFSFSSFSLCELEQSYLYAD